VVTEGYGLASGRSGSAHGLPAGTIALQIPVFRKLGLDLHDEVKGLKLGTINVRLSLPLILHNPDFTLENVSWAPEGSNFDISPETFSFVRCCFVRDNRYWAGLVYYPHPETKPPANTHDGSVLEILAPEIPGLNYGDDVWVICRSDAFSAGLGTHAR